MLVIRAGRQAQRDAAGCPGVDIGVDLRIGLGHLGGYRHGVRVTIHTRQAREASRVNRTGEIDKAHLPILVTRFVDNRDRVPCTHEHGCSVAIVLIGDIERGLILAHPRYKGNMTRCAKSPDAVRDRKDSYRTQARFRSQRQAEAFGIHSPFSGIAPVQREVIAEQVPLLPGPPDTVSASRERTRTKRKGIAISRKGDMCTASINRWSRMVKCPRLRRNKGQTDQREQ